MHRLPREARAALLAATLLSTGCAVSVDAPADVAANDPDGAPAASPVAGSAGAEAGAPLPSPVPPAATAPSDSDPFCPSGFAYGLAARLCLSADEALGPFPPAMVDACARAGGGSPCSSDRWARALAIALRGPGLCAPGSAVDATIGYCVAGGDAYGPFTVGAVARCKAAGGGASCESMRWSVTVLGGHPPAPTPSSRSLDVPYFSQYRAAVNPGGSCGNTSAAMVLAFWGRATTPDAVRAKYAGQATCGASYEAWQCADGLASIYAAEGLVGHAQSGGTRADIRRMIDEGRPVIVHTSMTAAGHIVVVVGYDEATSEWIVNDPAGRWCGDGYASCGGRSALAQRVRYSYASMGASVLGADGDVYLSAADTAPFTL
jgi:uncharacterized protein YvpB